MSKKQDDTMPTTFPQKYAKVLKELPEFKSIADAASPEDLKKIILESNGNIYNIEKAKEEDVKLTAAKELTRDLASGYKDAIKVQNVKSRYALFLLEGAGTEIGNSETE